MSNNPCDDCFNSDICTDGRNPAYECLGCGCMFDIYNPSDDLMCSRCGSEDVELI